MVAYVGGIVGVDPISLRKHFFYSLKIIPVRARIKVSRGQGARCMQNLEVHQTITCLQFLQFVIDPIGDIDNLFGVPGFDSKLVFHLIFPVLPVGQRQDFDVG